MIFFEGKRRSSTENKKEDMHNKDNREERERNEQLCHEFPRGYSFSFFIEEREQQGETIIAVNKQRRDTEREKRIKEIGTRHTRNGLID